jgi:hypothetical protein
VRPRFLFRGHLLDLAQHFFRGSITVDTPGLGTVEPFLDQPLQLEKLVVFLLQQAEAARYDRVGIFIKSRLNQFLDKCLVFVTEISVISISFCSLLARSFSASKRAGARGRQWPAKAQSSG